MNGRDDWTEERLRAAYRTLADHEAPGSLIDMTVERLRESPRSPSAGRFVRPLVALAAAAAVVIAGVAVWPMMSERLLQPARTGASPAPLTAAELNAGLPAGVIGLPTISVAEAIRFRDQEPGPDRRLLAVRGWHALPVRPCTVAAGGSPLEPACTDGQEWLMGAPERLGHGVGDAGTAALPSGPALNPIVTAGVERAPRDVTGLEPGSPVPVVFLGHFDDPRAAFCTATASPPCSRRFVVDMTAVVNGTLQSQIVWNGIAPELGVTPRLNADGLHPLVERAMGSRTVLTSIAVTTPDGLDSIDPRILRFQPAFGDGLVVWVVRGFAQGAVPPVLRTFLVDERSPATILELTDSGVERR